MKVKVSLVIQAYLFYLQLAILIDGLSRQAWLSRLAFFIDNCRVVSGE